ncbi:hypothetical protein [Ferruginibacter sp.]|nr:hypothetical protein [Ferruginibacter sp.]
MERKFYTDDFEQLLKERSDEFRMYPSKRVWHSIYNDLHPGRKWPSVAVSMVLIIALLLVSYWNSNDNNSSKVTTASTIDGSQNISIADNSVLQQNFPAITFNNQDVLLNPVVSSNKANIAEPRLQPETTIAPQKSNGVNNLNLPAIPAQKTYSKNRTAKNNTTATASEYPEQNSNSISLFSINNALRATENTTVDEGKVITDNSTVKETNITFDNTINSTEINTVPVKNIPEENLTATKKENTPEVINTAAPTKKDALSAEDKAWIEDYALHNKAQRGKWKDRLAMEFYVTPSIGYRKLASNSTMATNTGNYIAQSASPSGVNPMDHKPGLGLEAGLGLVYAAAKNIRLKAGVQANITNYIINADETNHPILTTLLLNELNTGYPNMVTRTSTVANTSGLQPVKLHNKTYQVSIPVGFALKLSGNSKFDWYAGAAAQPTFVIGGKANLISADKRNYVSDPTFIRHWSLNAALETYVQYKFNGYTLQVGPQLRYQLVSTYSKQFSLNENLYNTGLKIGVLKNF